jgi:TrmH family RNA methyltransferase
MVPIISSRQNPLVKTFRELARAPASDGTRLLLDGVHLVRDAIAAGAEFEAAAITSSHHESHTEEAQVARALGAAGVEVAIVGEQAFAAISPARTPSGIAAIVRRVPVSAQDICSRPDAFVVAAVDVQDPGNLGSLIRAAEAGGATGVLVCGASAGAFSWKTVRGSMGSLLRLPVANGLTTDDGIAAMRAARGRVVATTPRGGTSPDDIDWHGRVLLLLGGEGPGLGESAVSSADAVVTIPMSPPVESLNVAAAAAVLVYAARRQRSPLDDARGGLSASRRP